jgi:phosphopantothenoylcysteine decarboxylase/phosphopantothenate--cysteine ligase
MYAGEHSKKADLILVAPSTANTIGKIAAGIDDTPVTTLLTTGIGAQIPVIIAPAMHASMYKHPIVKENVNKLESIGIQVLMPRLEEGKAKIPGTNEIVNAVLYKLTVERDLEGKRILITAGPTRAYLDAFRYITNPSSGKMGVAIARNALERGAEVTLVYGPGTEMPPNDALIIPINSTEEMLDEVKAQLKAKNHHTVILSAAAADYGPASRKMEKTPSGKKDWSIELKPLPKIVEQVKIIDPEIFLIGFKAEYDVSDSELIQRAYDRLISAEMDLIVANDVARKGRGFGTDTNEVFIVDGNRKVHHISLTSKYEIAKKILSMFLDKSSTKIG